jgi:hypothetical protein
VLEFIQAVTAASSFWFISVEDGIELAPATTESEVESGLFVFCQQQASVHRCSS